MNLVIGSSSQLSHYFPKDYVKISSRNIKFDYLSDNHWDATYITFAEQRIYDVNIDYITPNYLYTLKVINSLLNTSDKIVCYTSCELWNDLSEPISSDTTPKFSPITNEYSISKLLLFNKVLELRKTNALYNKVIFAHPFYFNSVYRNKYFLFGKIFNSIVNKQQIKVGNLDFQRDMVHTNFVVKKSIEMTKDGVIGAGKLFNIRQFVKDLYQLNKMDFDYFVEEDISAPLSKPRLITANVDWDYSYETLLSDTQADILQMRELR